MQLTSREKGVEGIDQLFVEIEIINEVVMCGLYNPKDFSWLSDAVVNIKNILTSENADLNGYYNIYNYDLSEVDYIKCNTEITEPFECYLKIINLCHEILKAEHDLFSTP